MAKTTTISCQRRTSGKSARHKLKREGEIPGIIYAQGKPGTRVSLNQRNLDRLFSSQGTGGLFSLEVDDDPAVLAVVRELQRNPVDKHIIHVDFFRVDVSEEMEAAVAVQINGEEELREKGGFLQIGSREVQVKCLPQNLPDLISVDVSQIQPGQQVTAGLLILPAGVELLSDPAQVIASVLMERQAEEQEAGETENDAEGKD